MLGLEDVSELAHAIEDVLAQAREGRQFPPQLVEPLLRAADALRRLARVTRGHAGCWTSSPQAWRRLRP